MRTPSQKQLNRLLELLDKMEEEIKSRKNDPSFKPGITLKGVRELRRNLKATWENFIRADMEKDIADAVVKAGRKKLDAARAKLHGLLGLEEDRKN